jgi:hypothetical protein
MRNHPCARQVRNVARAAIPVVPVLVAPVALVRVGPVDLVGSCLVVPVLGAPAAPARVVLVGSCLVVPVPGGPVLVAPVVPVGPMGSDRVGPATIGAGGSMAPRGETVCRRGAGARRPVPRGTGSCRRRGVLHHRQSTTSATHSNRFGTTATTNGASGSSGFGFRCPSDEQVRQQHQQGSGAWRRSGVMSSTAGPGARWVAPLQTLAARVESRRPNCTCIEMFHRIRTEISLLTGHPAGSRRACANTPTGHRSTPGTRWTRADMAGHSGTHNEVKTTDLCQDA